MRFIPTSAVTVEKLKQLAKKTKTKLKVTHADALDRVARGAGYNHWGHVIWCAKEDEHSAGLPPLIKECHNIIEAARSGRGVLVITGPDVLDRPLILFSSSDGDAWLLEPNEGSAICLCWHGTTIDAHIKDNGQQIEIQWDGTFAIAGDDFIASIDSPLVGDRIILGYPIDHIRSAIQKVESFERKMEDVFVNRDTVELSPDLMETLIAKGWEREDLEAAARNGAQYSLKRNSLLYPVEFG